jgi:hypothetical protein
MTRPATRLGAVRGAALAALALVAGAIAVAVAIQRGIPWIHAYLIAWLYWAGLSLGSLSILLLHNLTGGAWGRAIRPILRGAIVPLPLVAIGFLPIAWQVESIYPWADAYHVAEDPVLQHKQPYLNVEWFRYRAIGYFSVWLALGLLVAWQSRTNPPVESRAGLRLRRLSGQGLALHGVAVTFAAIDWMMSLEPHWFSTIYGVIVFASQGLAAFAFTILAFTATRPRSSPVPEPLVDAQHDLGKLLLGFLMFWGYVHFSQFLIIWYGNLPEEVEWYIRRLEESWGALAVALVALHFAVPFLLLLSRGLKRNPTLLGCVAGLLFVMHAVETLWMVKPATEPSRASPTWLDLGMISAVGGAWLAVFNLALPRDAELDAWKTRGSHG